MNILSQVFQVQIEWVGLLVKTTVDVKSLRLSDFLLSFYIVSTVNSNDFRKAAVKTSRE